MSDRQIIEITGADRVKFLQGLVTNDVKKCADGIAYAALLTPQGKYLADFFMVGQADRILIDVDASLAEGLVQRLTMYKLRADVAISAIDMPVSVGVGTPPEGALIDPRSAELGWRCYGATIETNADMDALRVQNIVPQTGIELGPDSYILEMGFERLNGVDFKKGCYVGQEVTARMKHKTELKKGLVQVAVSGSVSPGTTIMAGEKEAGTIHTVSGNRALAYLRFDRANGEMTAGDAIITRV